MLLVLTAAVALAVVLGLLLRVPGWYLESRFLVREAAKDGL